MTKNTITTDTNKRSTLKVLALATGAIAAPGMVAAACKHGASTETVASSAIRGTGLIVSFAAKPHSDGSREVIVTNTNDHPVMLSQVYPSVVSTPEGQYDLNSLLVDGTQEFAPKHATTLTIQAANIDHLNVAKPPMQSADATLRVRTLNPLTNGGEPVTTMRSMFS